MPFAGRTAADVTPEEHERILEGGWEIGGFRFIFETFDDIFTDEKSNDVASEFVRNKIRDRQGPGDGGAVVPEGLPARRQAPATGALLLRDLQPGERNPRRRKRESDNRNHGGGAGHGEP